MKRLFLFSALVFAAVTMAFAQLPQGFNYQAVARDQSGAPLKETPLTVRIAVLQGWPDGTVVWQEDHSVTTNEFGLFSLVIGDTSATRSGGSLNSFDEIDWKKGGYYLRVSLGDGTVFQDYEAVPFRQVPYAEVARGMAGGWEKVADTLVYLQGSIAIGTPSPEGGKLVVRGDDLSGTGPLFEVKRKDGQTVFAVYNDSIRMYVNASEEKGPRGGFAIGGFNFGKGGGRELFRVTPDSVRIYLDNSQTKRPRGGFAIGGLNPGKGVYDEYFRISGASSIEVVDPSEPRVLWYPRKEAFLSGRVLVESPDSVGYNSLATGFESKAIGDYSQALGYKCVAKGNYSSAFGDSALAFGANSVSMGSHTQAFGKNSLAAGWYCRTHATGALALGRYAIAYDNASVAIGHVAQARGVETVAIGYKANTWGESSVAIGRNAWADKYGTAVGFSHDYTVDQGKNTQAKGYFSVALGTSVITRKYGSCALGYWLDNNDSYSVVLGKYNQPISSGTALVVGNGTSDNARSNAFIVYDNGNAWIKERLGIGIENPETKLAISGLTGTSDGTLLKIYNDNVYYASSSRETKEDIHPLQTDFSRILRAQPVSFRDKVSGRRNIGFIAEEFDSLGLHDLVIYRDGKPISLKYELVSLYNLEIIKRQQELIGELRKEVETLRRREEEVARLEQRIEELEKLLEVITRK